MQIERYEKTIFEWKFSPMANYICPTFQVTRNESNAPRGLALLLSLVAGPQRRPLDRDLAERLYQCSSCWLCTSLGYDDTDPAALFIAGRADALEAGCAPAAVAALRERLSVGSDEAHLGVALAGLPGFGRQARVGLFVDPFIAARFPEELGRNLELLKRAGEEPGIPAAPGGSGAQLFALGCREEARRAASAALRAIRDGGYRTLVVLSPYDYKALRSWAPELGIEPPAGVRLVPYPALLLERLKSGALSFRKDGRPAVTYLDAAHFVRPETVFSGIAGLLEGAPGVSYRAMWRSGRLAYPDSGDFLPDLYPGIAAAIDRKVLEEAKAAGAEILLTSCFYSLRNLRAAASAAGTPAVAVEDLGSFLQRRLA
jgi:Fe-S oxidoreductase